MKCVYVTGPAKTGFIRTSNIDIANYYDFEEAQLAVCMGKITRIAVYKFDTR